jgi:hypothetical protein
VYGLWKVIEKFGAGVRSFASMRDILIYEVRTALLKKQNCFQLL